MIDPAKLSDADLAALLQQADAPPAGDQGYGPGVRAPDASTGRGVDVWVGGDQAAPPAPVQSPEPQPSNLQNVQTAPPPKPEAPSMSEMIQRAMLQAVPGGGVIDNLQQDGGVRAFSTGVPVLGAYSDEINAGLNAFLAPGVEPVLRGLERLGIDTPYDERFRLDNAGDLGERFAAALNMEAQQNQAAKEARPDAHVAGMVGGALAAAPLLPTTSMGAATGLLPRVLAGGLEGGVLGAAQGYGEGAGGAGDPSRLKNMATGAAIGAGAGAAFPLALKGLGSAWGATGGKVVDAVRSRAPNGALGEPDVAALAEMTGGTPGIPAGLAISGDRELADILATLGAAPKFPEAAPSALDDAYARIAQAAQRQGQSPDELAQAVAALGPRGVIADSGQPMRDLTRAAMNRPSGAEGIARANLDLRQMGLREGGDYVARPSSARIMDEAAAGMGGPGTSYLSTFDVLNRVQKEAADPLYAQVREIGATDSPTLQKLMSRPSMKKAVAHAYKLAKEEGRNPEDLAIVSVESPDNWVSSLPEGEQALLQAQGAILRRASSKAPSQGKSLAKFIADGGGVVDDGGDFAAMGAGEWHKGKPYQRGLIAPAGGQAQPPLPGTPPRAYQPGGSSADDWALRAWEAGYFPQWNGRPTVRELQDALAEELRGKPRYARDMASELTDRMARRDEAEELVYRGGVEPPPSPDDYVGRPAPTDEPAFEAVPTAETWDYMKRALDDQLAPYREGKKAWDEEARAINRTLLELRGELVSLNPVYGEALEAYSGPAAMKDALEAGRRAFLETGEGLQRKFADFSAGEREMYRMGAVQALREKLGNQDVTFNAAQRAGVLKPAQLERFKELFPSDTAFQRFVQTLDREAAMFSTRSDLFRVSTTAKQLAHANEEAPGALEAAAETAVNIKTGGAAAMIRALSNLGAPKMSAETAEAVAAITTSLDQSQLPAVIKRLEETASTRRLAEGLKSYMRYGTTTGAAGAFTAEPVQ